MDQSPPSTPYWAFLDYRDFLRTELAERSIKNSSYSMSSFARSIGISRAAMSLVLSGKRGISSERARAVAPKLKFDSKKTSFFLDLLDSIEARSPSQRLAAGKRVAKERQRLSYQSLSLEKFKVIEDWQHSAILVLATCKSFRPDLDWIARELGLSLATVKDAVDRLIDLGLLSPEKKGLKPTHEYLKIGEEIPSSSLRKYHSRILEKATQALEAQPMEKREFLTYMMAVDKSRLGEAKDALRGFASTFAHDFSREQDADQVYCFAMQFFDIREEKP